MKLKSQAYGNLALKKTVIIWAARLEAEQENFSLSVFFSGKVPTLTLRCCIWHGAQALILCLQRKDISVLLPGIGYSACVGWHCLCGFVACGLRVLLLLSHCSSCGGALRRWRGRRDQQRIDHHVDGRSGLSTGHKEAKGSKGSCKGCQKVKCAPASTSSSKMFHPIKKKKMMAEQFKEEIVFDLLDNKKGWKHFFLVADSHMLVAQMQEVILTMQIKWKDQNVTVAFSQLIKWRHSLCAPNLLAALLYMQCIYSVLP